MIFLFLVWSFEQENWRKKGKKKEQEEKGGKKKTRKEADWELGFSQQVSCILSQKVIHTNQIIKSGIEKIQHTTAKSPSETPKSPSLNLWN